jgi:hypothetical protein
MATHITIPETRRRHFKSRDVASPSFPLNALENLRLAFWTANRPAHVDNAFIEAFNGRLRDECLNVHQFASIADAQAKIEAWRIDYGTNVTRSRGLPKPKRDLTARQSGWAEGHGGANGNRGNNSRRGRSPRTLRGCLVTPVSPGADFAKPSLKGGPLFGFRLQPGLTSSASGLSRVIDSVTSRVSLRQEVMHGR